MSVRLFVGNLSFETSEGDLRNLFTQVGPVSSCSVITDKFTGKSRGFAFVEMGSKDDASKAISQLDGKDLGGRSLKVNEARPREERPRGEFRRERF